MAASFRAEQRPGWDGKMTVGLGGIRLLEMEGGQDLGKAQ